MLKSFRTILSIFLLTAFSAFWAVGQIPGLHVHKAQVFVLHADGECHHADRHHSDFGGFPSEDSHDENCLICHWAHGFYPLESAPADSIVFLSPDVVPVLPSSFKSQAVSFDHASRAPPLV